MADGGGPLSDDAIRAIVQQLNASPTPTEAAPPATSVAFPPPGAPEVTPTMMATASAPVRPAPDDWAPPVPAWTPPPVAAVPMGALVAPRSTVPSMGMVMGRR